MSQLGKAVRDFLAARTGFSTYFPGGIHPDTNPVGQIMPYAVFNGITRTRLFGLEGATKSAQERVQFTVVAMTRAAAQASGQWMADQIRATPSRQTVGDLVIFQWRVEDETTSAEIFGDGSDEAARTHEVDVVGSYKEI